MMQLVTEAIRLQLLENGGKQEAVKGTAQEIDFWPVVKFFDPCGGSTWLITEMAAEDPDILFGLCDLGMGFPELGSVRLSELESLCRPGGLGIERDIHFAATHPLSVYARAANGQRRIVEALSQLDAAVVAAKSA